MLETDSNHTITPYNAFKLMVEDYKETVDGSISEIPYDEVPPHVGPYGEYREQESMHDTDTDRNENLSQLRRSLTLYGLQEVGLEMKDISRSIELDEEVLRQDLEKDEFLLKHAEDIKGDVLSPEAMQEFTHQIDLARIGWVSSDERVDIPVTEIDQSNTEPSYYFANLTGLHKKTKDAFERLRAEGKLDDLMTLLWRDGIPHLTHVIRSGQGGGSGGLRTVNHNGSDTKQRTVNTSYPAYKLDVNGTQNRAVVLHLGEKDSKPVYGLGVLCDHDDQDKVLNVLDV